MTTSSRRTTSRDRAGDGPSLGRRGLDPQVRRRIAALALSSGLGAVAFGGVARTVGFDPVAAVAFAALAFSGGAQWTTLTLVDQGAATVLIAGVALVASVRFVPMAASIAGHLPRRAIPRALAAHVVIDPTWALAMSRPAAERRRVLLLAGGAIWAASVAGTTLGAVAGVTADGPLGRVAAVLMPLLLLELLLPLLRGRSERAGAAAGALAAVAAAPLGIPGGGVLLAAPVAAVLALRSRG
jgi:predicted branched-subunit amino acid permease